MPIVPEPSDWTLVFAHAAALCILVAFFSFGALSRSFLVPVASNLPVAQQLAAIIIAGLIVVGAFARSAFAAMAESGHSIAIDCIIMVLYVAFVGALSRESVERFSIPIRRILNL